MEPQQLESLWSLEDQGFSHWASLFLRFYCLRCCFRSLCFYRRSFFILFALSALGASTAFYWFNNSFSFNNCFCYSLFSFNCLSLGASTTGAVTTAELLQLPQELQLPEPTTVSASSRRIMTLPIASSGHAKPPAIAVLLCGAVSWATFCSCTTTWVSLLLQLQPLQVLSDYGEVLEWNEASLLPIAISGEATPPLRRRNGLGRRSRPRRRRWPLARRWRGERRLRRCCGSSHIQLLWVYFSCFNAPATFCSWATACSWFAACAFLLFWSVIGIVVSFYLS